MRRGVIADLVTRVRRPIAPEQIPVGERFIGLEHAPPGQLRIAGWGDGATQRSQAQVVHEGDLLFGALRPGFRKVVRSPFSAVGSAEWLVLRPRAGISPGLALAVLAHPTTIASATRLATGTRMPRVRWKALRQIPIELPSPDHQRALGDLALLFEERLRTLHRAQALRARFMVDLLERVAGKAPSPTLDEVVIARRGALTSTDDIPPDAPVYGVADLPRSGLELHGTTTTVTRSRKRAVQRGDVLISLLRPELHKVGLCPEDGFASLEIAALTPAPGWLGVTLARARSASSRAAWIAASHGTRMPRFSLATLLATPTGLTADAHAGVREALDGTASTLLAAMDHATTLRLTRDRLVDGLLTEDIGPRSPIPPAPDQPRASGYPSRPRR